MVQEASVQQDQQITGAGVVVGEAVAVGVEPSNHDN
jgi:hypothetical protein